jgi:hypothetical protein
MYEIGNYRVYTVNGKADAVYCLTTGAMLAGGAAAEQLLLLITAR